MGIRCYKQNKKSKGGRILNHIKNLIGKNTEDKNDITLRITNILSSVMGKQIGTKTGSRLEYRDGKYYLYDEDGEDIEPVAQPSSEKDESFSAVAENNKKGRGPIIYLGGNHNDR